jgi:hypothetical protein
MEFKTIAVTSAVGAARGLGCSGRLGVIGQRVSTHSRWDLARPLGSKWRRCGPIQFQPLQAWPGVWQPEIRPK